MQKRAVKAVSGLRSQSYEDRLVELKLPSLHEPRCEIDMVQTYKLINDDKIEEFFYESGRAETNESECGQGQFAEEKV